MERRAGAARGKREGQAWTDCSLYLVVISVVVLDLDSGLQIVVPDLPRTCKRRFNCLSARSALQIAAQAYTPALVQVRSTITHPPVSTSAEAPLRPSSSNSGTHANRAARWPKEAGLMAGLDMPLRACSTTSQGVPGVSWRRRRVAGSADDQWCGRWVLQHLPMALIDPASPKATLSRTMAAEFAGIQDGWRRIYVDEDGLDPAQLDCLCRWWQLTVSLYKQRKGPVAAGWARCNRRTLRLAAPRQPEACSLP